MDPKVQVGGVVVHAAALSAVGKLSPNATAPGRPCRTPGRPSSSAIPRAPEAIGRVQVALSGSGAAGRKVLIQAAHRDIAAGSPTRGPRRCSCPTARPDPARRLAGEDRRPGHGQEPRLAGAAGRPLQGLPARQGREVLKVRIDIPGKLHTLLPEYQIRKDAPMHNSPMTLADVNGDFLAQVAVTGEINPGRSRPASAQVRDLAYTFQSAGLLLYQDKNNFIRLERAGSIVTDRLTPIHRLLVEVVQDGKQAINPIYLDIPEGDTTLIMARRKGRIRCMFVPAGSDSSTRFREFASLNFPSKVKVGLSASNISAQPFTANFSGSP